MRKFLFVLLILLLCVAMFFVVYYGIPGFEAISTYTDIQAAYEDYQSTLKVLENKNENELPAVLSKLNTDYNKAEGADADNVVKQYNTNKEKYEYYLALEKANEMIDEADIYDVEYIWTTLGTYAKNNFLNMTMDIVKSEADLESDDYIMCNLNIEVVGQYQYIAKYLNDVEMDSSIGFQINDFFAEGYSNTARNQNKTTNMDTNDIKQQGVGEDGSTQYTVTSSTQSGKEDDEHALDIKASFRVYNIPINKRTITNVKAETVVAETTDEESSETM